MRWSLKRQSFCRSPSNRENFPRTGLASADLHRGNASDGPMRRLVAPGGLRCFNPCRLRGSAGQQIIVRRLLIVARTKEPIGRRQGTHSGERVSSACSPLSPTSSIQALLPAWSACSTGISPDSDTIDWCAVPGSGASHCLHRLRNHGRPDAAS